MYSALMARSSAAGQTFAAMYREPADQSIEGQIRAANAFWRMQLGMANVCTTSSRECLQDTCGLQDWLRLFSTQVAPMIVNLGLPLQWSDRPALAVV